MIPIAVEAITFITKINNNCRVKIFLFCLYSTSNKSPTLPVNKYNLNVHIINNPHEKTNAPIILKISVKAFILITSSHNHRVQTNKNPDNPIMNPDNTEYNISLNIFFYINYK